MARMMSDNIGIAQIGSFAYSGKKPALGISVSTLVPILLVMAAFGIYITDFGFRLEHFIIYPLFYISLLMHPKRITLLKKIRPLFILVLMWIGLFFWLITVTLVSTGLDNFRIVLAPLWDWITL